MKGFRKELPSREDLCASLEYDAEIGTLKWKTLRSAGKPAGSLTSYGYMAIRFGGRSGGLILSHRAIWKMVTGEDPIEIDHINNVKTDNRFCNLRAANHPQNGQNRLLTKSNTSGYKGVSWYKKLGKWKAQICVDRKHVHIGYFADPEQAHVAYLEAAKRLHGDFHNSGVTA